MLRWGQGKEIGTCHVSLKNQGAHSPFGLWSIGYVELHLGYLGRFAPFDSARKRSEWLGRLNSIPGIRVTDTETGKFPHFPLAALTHQVALGRFLETVDWVLAEIERVSAGALRELVAPEVAEALDPDAVERLNRFLANLLELGFMREESLTIDRYKATMLCRYPAWDEYRPFAIPVLYFHNTANPQLRFRMDRLPMVKDLDIDELEEALLAAGCTRANRKTTPVELILTRRNDQAIFDRLYEILGDLMRKHRIA